MKFFWRRKKRKVQMGIGAGIRKVRSTYLVHEDESHVIYHSSSNDMVFIALFHEVEKCPMALFDDERSMMAYVEQKVRTEFDGMDVSFVDQRDTEEE